MAESSEEFFDVRFALVREARGGLRFGPTQTPDGADALGAFPAAPHPVGDEQGAVVGDADLHRAKVGTLRRLHERRVLHKTKRGAVAHDFDDEEAALSPLAEEELAAIRLGQAIAEVA